VNFKPGQLVKLNTFAISCIVPNRGGFIVLTELGYQTNRTWDEDSIETIPVGVPCLIVENDNHCEAYDKLVMLFKDVLVRISAEYVEQI